MLNHELLKTEIELNKFTKALKEFCIKNGSVLVRMRDDRWVKVCYKEEIDDHCEGFYTKDWNFVWELNGKSITSSDFDLIEFK